MSRGPRALVLTWHSNNVLGRGYAENDHVALAEDLRLLAAEGCSVRPLGEVVDALFDGRGELPERCVALSFDDGSWFDWHALPHPTLGVQPGFRQVLQQAPLPVQATAFVIVSPEARAELDRTCLIGQGWWGEAWWPEATAEGLITVENHSWDHNHDSLSVRVAADRPGGTFANIDSHALADAQIRQAADYLDARRGAPGSRLFAYPYGEYSDYLAREYFPRHRAEHRQAAAFTTEPQPLTPDEERWQLGRYVCGQHWRSPDGLRQILRDAFGGAGH